MKTEDIELTNEEIFEVMVDYLESAKGIKREFKDLKELLDFTEGLGEEEQYEIAEAVLITETLRQIEEDKKNGIYRTYTLEEILEEFEFE